MIFERFANLKYKFGNKVFWTKGYYVSTVGLDTKKVQEYIRDQEKEDLMTDSMSKMYPVKWTLNKKCYTHWVLLCDN